ncbi:MAG: Rpn family recombination-promoting nuclease/putative transposase, partial [Agathobacter sp.]
IVLGQDLDEKEFILDILVRMNDNTILNLEMQVVNLHNWIERSMSYLCRTFDNLDHGENYTNVRPAIQIGLLDYTLFSEAPEFYATYYLMNEKTHQKYSDKLRLSVLDLTRIDLATEEDKLYGIDHWASLFKAQTWEELKMLAQDDKVMTDAVSTIYDITQDSILRQEIRARDERIALENHLKNEADKAKKETAEAKKETAEAKKETAEAKKETAEAKKETAIIKQQLEEKNQYISEQSKRIAELEKALKELQK